MPINTSRRHRRTYKYEAKEFHEKACVILETIPGINRLSHRPATQTLYACTNYELETVYGRLEIHVYDDWIPCRFTDHAFRGKLPHRANQYSGKWNFHYTFQKSSDLKQLDSWLEFVWREIEDITPQAEAKRKEFETT